MLRPAFFHSVDNLIINRVIQVLWDTEVRIRQFLAAKSSPTIGNAGGFLFKLEVSFWESADIERGQFWAAWT